MNTPQASQVRLQWSDGLTQQQRDGLRGVLTTARLKRWVGTALIGPGEITVRIVGAAEGRRLNREFRGKDYATNVLTFAYTPTPFTLADLVLCAPVVAREARAQGKPLVDHYAHLVVHGTLHAQGYDHENNDDAANEMESLEVLLMGCLGLPNPY
ncbi:MAG: rRNA maturation RNase YbeY [Pseudomonadota bacterium]|jgi:probable rRNA maturation factor